MISRAIDSTTHLMQPQASAGKRRDTDNLPYRRVCPIFCTVLFTLVVTGICGCQKSEQRIALEKEKQNAKQNAAEKKAPNAFEKAMNAFDDLLKRSNEISSEDQADDKSLPLEMPTKLVSRWENLVSEMSEVLMLDETQKERIKESLGNEATKIKNWLKEYGSLVENIDKKIIDAAKNRDLSELKELVRRGTELRSEITDLYQGFKDSAMNSLPQDKRAEWQGHLLLKRFNEMIEDLDLRPEQEEAVGRLAVSIAMKTGSSSSWESEGISQLMKLFEQDVLEKEQKDQWDLLQQVDPKKYLPGFDLWQ